MIGTQIDRRLLFILYLLSFILLREWLLPVMMLTDTSYLQLFLLFTALFFYCVGTGEMVAVCSSKNHLYYLGYPVHVFR